MSAVVAISNPVEVEEAEAHHEVAAVVAVAAEAGACGAARTLRSSLIPASKVSLSL